MGMWTGLGWPRIELADGCECGNEPSGSVKCGEFLVNPQVASHKGSGTRCRSEVPQDSALSPLSRRILNNRVLWGTIISTRTQ